MIRASDFGDVGGVTPAHAPVSANAKAWLQGSTTETVVVLSLEGGSIRGLG